MLNAVGLTIKGERKLISRCQISSNEAMQTIDQPIRLVLETNNQYPLKNDNFDDDMLSFIFHFFFFAG